MWKKHFRLTIVFGGARYDVAEFVNFKNFYLVGLQVDLDCPG